MTNPVRLDDLIEAIKKVHTDALDQLSDAVVAADAPRRRGRPPHRPLRRPGPPLRRLLDRHRPQHGRHQAGRPEALRPQGRGGRRRPRPEPGLRPLHPARPQRRRGRAERGPRRRQHRDPHRAPGARPARRARGPRGAGDHRAGRRRWTPSAPRRPPPCRPAAAEVPDLIPFDAAAKKALELTFREALRLGHNYVGTEHILLALLELEDGEGVLTGLGVDKDAVEAAVTEALAAVLGGEAGK